MRFLPVALLGLASVAVADISNWNDIIGDMPKCTQTCIDTYYKDIGFEKKCGKPDEASTDCLCGIKDVKDLQDAVRDLNKCIQSGCSSTDISDAASGLEGFQDRLMDFSKQCTGSSSGSDEKSSSGKGGSSGSSGSSNASNNDDSSSGSGDDENGAGSLAPGFNAMLASGALLLAGAAL